MSPQRLRSIGARTWRPPLSLVGVLLLASSCGAPRMSTAEFKYVPGPSRAVQEDLGRELTALAPDSLSSSDLDRKRGGFSVGGMDLSIGLQVTTQVEGLLQVQTNLGMNNAGQWVLVATRTQTFPTISGLTTAGATSPPVTPKSQNQFVVVAQSGGPPTSPSTTVAGDPATTPISTGTTGGSPKALNAGPTTFSVVAGDPATTQVVQQITQNSVSTVISNQLNNVTVNQQTILNVTINNAAAISSTIGAITAANRIGAQVSLHR